MMVKVFPPLSSRFTRVRASNDEYVPVHKSHHTDWVNESRYRDKGHLPTA